LDSHDGGFDQCRVPPSPTHSNQHSDTTTETAPNPSQPSSSYAESCASDKDSAKQPPSAAAATASRAQPRQPLSSAEASDMQAAADSYVQVILSGEAPYQIVWASEAWLKLCGYPNHEACGKTLQLVEGPLTSQDTVARLMEAMRTGVALKAPIVYHARSGRAFSHEIRVEPLKDSQGLVQCFQVTSADVQILSADGSAPCAPADAAKGEGDARLEIDEMLEWLDSGAAQRPSPSPQPMHSE